MQPTPDLIRPGGILLVVSTLWASLAQGSLVEDPERWTTNGMVQTIVRSGETIYIGGQFSYVGPRWTGGAIPVDLAQGEAVPGYPKVNGRVRVVIPDGAGGWFLGGEFTLVGGLARNGVARISADLSVSSWNPVIHNTAGPVVVRALARVGSSVFVGGTFTHVGNLARKNLAAVDAESGVVGGFQQDANARVQAFALDGPTLYVGGEFTELGGIVRHRIAALEVATGAVTPWNPTAIGVFSPHGSVPSIMALAVGDGCVYAAGNFFEIGGLARRHLAALDLVSGSALPTWRADANYEVLALAVNGPIVYAGGRFHDVEGHFRSRLVALDATTGAVGGWNPSSNDEVYAIVVDGPTIYVGGALVHVGGAPRNHFAALDAVTGAALAWQPAASSWVEALALNDGVLYVGGRFESFGGVMRGNVAALDAATGRATPWKVVTNGGVAAIAVAQGSVFIGGNYNDINGEFEWSLAAVDSVTGAVRPWSLGCSFTTNYPYPGYVNALAVREGLLYVGGRFDELGGHPREGIAAVDVATGATSSWTASPGGGWIRALVVQDTTLYVGGSFANLGGAPRRNLAALHPITGRATSWNPDVDSGVHTLVVTDSLVYVGGWYRRVGGQDRTSLAAVGRLGGEVTGWNPYSTNVGSAQVHTLALHGNTLFAGGFFTNHGGQQRSNFAAIDVETALAEERTANTDRMVHALLLDDGHLYLGGEFTTLNGAIRPYFTRLEIDDVTSTTLDLVSTHATPGLVEIVWHSGAGAPATATVYRRTEHEPWSAVGVIAPDARGRWSFEDATVTPGARYGYRLGFDGGGVERLAGEVWVDVPNGRGLALAGMRPHPASSRFQVSFALPDATPARLELLDIAGRRVWHRDVGALGAGAHVIEGDDARRFAPGVYHLRLTRAGRSLVTRAVLVR